MIPRKSGRRVAGRTAVRKKNTVKRNSTCRTTHQKNEPLRPKERRQLIQLVICCSVFLLLVAVKLLLPDQMARMNAGLSQAMARNMDIRAVYAAMGRAFAGETNDVADEVYQAVFHSVPEEEFLTATVPVVENITAFDMLRTYREAGKDSENKTEEGALSDVQQEEQISAMEYVLYSNQNLPEDVSMEQAILGFDYCTPVQGTISSDFGYRDHPMEGEERFHYGIDLAANTGTDINCFAAGTITAIGESSSYGKYCMVAHENGYTTLYAHCSKITVSSGAAVQMGQKIAEVGETGAATGPHLHFEMQKDDTYLNPIYYVSGT